MMNEPAIRAVVDEQANDEGLWFVPVTITEDYLQKALRRLHEVIEGKSSEECAAEVLKGAPEERLMTDWLPMLDAPKNGTEIRLRLSFDVLAYWDNELETWVLSRPINLETTRNPQAWRAKRT